jgi:hypothetical protein
MKFIVIAQVFAAFALVTADPHKSNLRKLAEEESSSDLEWGTCRDGTSCRRDNDCNRGGCTIRRRVSPRAGFTCRNGQSCTKFCSDGSLCKRRNNEILDFE